MAGTATCRRGAGTASISQPKKIRLDAEFDQLTAETQAVSHADDDAELAALVEDTVAAAKENLMAEPSTSAVRVVVDVNLLVRGILSGQVAAPCLSCSQARPPYPRCLQAIPPGGVPGARLSAVAPPLSSDTQTAPAPDCADLRSGGVGRASASSGFVPRPG